MIHASYRSISILFNLNGGEGATTCLEGGGTNVNGEEGNDEEDSFGF